MTTIKRIVCFMLLLLLLPQLISSVHAAQVPTISVDAINAEAGDTVEVAIRLRHNPGISSLKVTVIFDDVLTLSSVSYNAQIDGMTMQPQHLASPLTLNWISPMADAVGDWTFAIMSFTVSDDALPGSYPITLTYNAEDVYNVKEEDVTFAIENGSVTVHGTQATTAFQSTELPDPDNVPAGDRAPMVIPALMFLCLSCAAVLTVIRRKNKRHKV